MLANRKPKRGYVSQKNGDMPLRCDKKPPKKKQKKGEGEQEQEQEEEQEQQQQQETWCSQRPLPLLVRAYAHSKKQRDVWMVSLPIELKFDEQAAHVTKETNILLN